jgi:hypothetical protein
VGWVLWMLVLVLCGERWVGCCGCWCGSASPLLPLPFPLILLWPSMRKRVVPRNIANAAAEFSLTSLSRTVVSTFAIAIAPPLSFAVLCVRVAPSTSTVVPYSHSRYTLPW